MFHFICNDNEGCASNVIVVISKTKIIMSKDLSIRYLHIIVMIKFRTRDNRLFDWYVAASQFSLRAKRLRS